MDIFSVFTLLGGLAFFLYGMHVLSAGLEKMVGGKLEHILQRMTSNPFKGLLLGAGITIAIQSSSALTVMLVGLVNSGIMQLGQTVGVIMGSNIGTTLTAWIFSLAGISSDNILIRLLKPESFSPLIAIAGIILLMAGKGGKKKEIGTVMLGFSVLMTGMTLMSDSVAPLADMPEFSSILTMFENPLLGVLVGAVFTGIIQSSAASVGILQALALTGSVSYGMAIPIIMGQNIGTCVTALLSAIGANRNAKRVTVIHLSFNLIGTTFFLLLYLLAGFFVDFTFTALPIDAVGIALVHSIFNIATTALLLPFADKLKALAYLIIPDKKAEKGAEADIESYELLDDRLLRSPSFAIAQCSNLTSEMAQLACDTLKTSIKQLDSFSDEMAEVINENENLIDLYEDKLGTFLVKLSARSLSKEDSREISRLLHAIGDFERIGDHAVNILHTAAEIREKSLSFSKEAKQELKVMRSAVCEILDTCTRAFVDNDAKLATHVEPLEEVIDGLEADIRSRHIERLQRGDCTIELGFILADLLNDFERVADHCSNIAVCVIRIRENALDQHLYLADVKDGNSPEFTAMFDEFKEKYMLPKEAAAL